MPGQSDFKFYNVKFHIESYLKKIFQFSARLAQLGRVISVKPSVVGSNPTWETIFH